METTIPENTYDDDLWKLVEAWPRLPERVRWQIFWMAVRGMFVHDLKRGRIAHAFYELGRGVIAAMETVIQRWKK